jgi:predicted aspartyl protease
MIRPVFLLSALLISGSALDAQNAAKPDPGTDAQVDGTSQAQDVRFHNTNNDRMTVPVRLGGSGPYQFLVDTGADRSAVSSAIVAHLSLAPAAPAQLHSTAGMTIVPTARVPSLEFTKPAQKMIEAAVLDSANMGADGIVGSDVLASQRVQLDFEKNTMTVVPSRTDIRHEPGEIVVEARRKNGRLILTDAIANGQEVTVVLDTGSEVCVGNEALRQRLQGRSLVDGKQTIDLVSVTGATVAGDYMFVRKLQIGGITLENLAVVFADLHTFKQLKLDQKPAVLLGMNAMRAFKKVSIDFANRKFRVVLPEHSQLETRLALAGRG